MRRIGDDRGAASVLVALFVAFLMIPLTAVVVDVGGMYSERRRLQNSADSGAMATALSCVENGTCDTDAKSQSKLFAEGNNVLGVDVEPGWPCGTYEGLPSCTSDPRCEATPDNSMKYAELLVTSKDEWEPTLLPDSTKNVSACARAAVSGIGSNDGGLAATMSKTCWDAATSSGTAWDSEIVLDVHGSAGSPGDCRTGNGQIIPGGFGWLDADPDTCIASTNADSDAGSGNGASGTGNQADDCKDELLRLVGCTYDHGLSCTNDPVITYVPIYDNPHGIGYHIIGYAAFRVTGYHLAGGGQPRDVPSQITGNVPCRGNTKCISGFFTATLVNDPSLGGGGPNMGATTVQMFLK